MVGPRRSRLKRGSRKKLKPAQPQLADPGLSEFLKKATEEGGRFILKSKPGPVPKPEAGKPKITVYLTRELDRELEAERLRINAEHADRPDLQIKRHEHSKLIVLLLRESLRFRGR